MSRRARMPVQTFRHDDAGYEEWLTAHRSGWVVNARRPPSPAYLKLHRADCFTISQLQPGHSRWTTGEYIKVCAERRDELDAWAQLSFGAELQDGCHCVEHGGARERRRRVVRRSGRVRSPAASATASVVVDAEGYRTLETTRLIPFEPSDAAPWNAASLRRTPPRTTATG